MKRKIKLVCITGLLLACSSVFATSNVGVSFGSVDSDPIIVGKSFSVDVIGNFNAPDFVDPLDGKTKDNEITGGAFKLSFNPSVLALQSVDVNDSIVDIGKIVGVIDNDAGTLGETGFATFNSLADDTFVIATLNFTGLISGVSELVLSDPNSPLFVWASTGDLADVTPVFEPLSLTVMGANQPPVLDPVSNQTVNEGENLTLPITANDPDPGDVLTMSQTGMPEFCSFTDNGAGSATLDCNPDVSDAGVTNLTMTVTDQDGLTDNENFSLSVGDVNQPPVLDAIGDQMVKEGENLILPITASDPDPGDVLTISQTGLPGLCSFIDNGSGSATLDCNPVLGDAGIYDVTIFVSDNGLPRLDNSETISITVGNADPPVIKTLWVSIDRSSDDAEETISNGAMSLSSTDLEFTQDGTKTQSVGMRFNGLGIPPQATITRAYIQFTVDETSTEDTILTVRGEDADNAQTYTTERFNISNRIETTAQVEWIVPQWNAVGVADSAQATPNLINIVQEIVDRNGWSFGNSMAFIFTGTGKQVAESFNGTATPVLHIEFESLAPINRAPDAKDDGTDIEPAYIVDIGQELNVPNGSQDIIERNDDAGYPVAVVSSFGPLLTNNNTVPGTIGQSNAGGILSVNADGSFSYTPPSGYSGIDSFVYTLKNIAGEDTATVTIQVSSVSTLLIPIDRSSDDAEEQLASGAMRLKSSDLELVRDGTTEQMIGLRYNGINIPKGATISYASVQFETDETSSELTQLIIQGEDTANAETFNDTRFNISSRMKTTEQVFWNLSAWNVKGSAGDAQATPNLAVVIQAIVNRSDWQANNSLALIFSGEGKRVAESFNGTAPPVLHIEFSTESKVPNAVDDGSDSAPAYSTGIDLILTVPNGPSDIVEANDDTGIPTANISSFGPITGTETVAGGSSFSLKGGILSVNADGSFVYTPPSGYQGLDSFVYFLANSEGNDTAKVTIEVLSQTSIMILVDRSSDDAEEKVIGGSMDINSTDLELIRNGSTEQWVGLRYNGVNIPKGAIISHAYIQFKVDETASETTMLTVHGEDIGNAATFVDVKYNISSRVRTLAAVFWEPQAWDVIGVEGADQATPNLAPVIQEIVNGDGWGQGNSLVLIISGTGKRVAESFNGTEPPPTLYITFE